MAQIVASISKIIQWSLVIVTVTVTFAQRKTLSTAQTTNYTIGLQINEKSAKTNERDKIVESVIKQLSDVCGGKMCKKVSFKTWRKTVLWWETVATVKMSDSEISEVMRETEVLMIGLWDTANEDVWFQW